MLHFLNTSLNNIGAKSRVVEFGQSISEDEKNDAIIIYPEVIHDNPLCARNVARYMLNKDGLLWGKKILRSERDFVFTYHRHFEPDAPVAYFPLADLEKLNFSDDIASRELNMLYFGKGPSLKMEFDGKIPYLLVTRSWPSEKDILLEFLKNCRYFHTSDCMSSILMEALLCGATPVIHYWDPAFNKDEVLSGELPEVYQLQSEQDFSPENVLKKSESMRKKIQIHQANWRDTLSKITEMMHAKFT